MSVLTDVCSFILKYSLLGRKQAEGRENLKKDRDHVTKYRKGVNKGGGCGQMVRVKTV